MWPASASSAAAALLIVRVSSMESPDAPLNTRSERRAQKCPGFTDRNSVRLVWCSARPITAECRYVLVFSPMNDKKLHYRV